MLAFEKNPARGDGTGVRLGVTALLAASALMTACGGGDGTDAEGPADAPVEGPVESAVPAEVDQPIIFPPGPSRTVSHGCAATLVSTWKADDPAAVPDGVAAVIRITGPRIAGTYRRRVESGDVRLRLKTPALKKDRAEWKATLVSVAGQPVTPDLPISHPFLNTACGPGPPPKGRAVLPKGAPVVGAPCDPDEPPPAPGLVCKPVR